MQFKSKMVKAYAVDLEDVKEACKKMLDHPGSYTAEQIESATSKVRNARAKLEQQEALDEGKEFDEYGNEVRDMTPVNSPVYAVPKSGNGPFKSFGEQLHAIVRSTPKDGTPATVDSRLIAVQNAASGANESIPSEGGFLVQEDFAAGILKNVYNTSVLAPLCRPITISSGSNAIKLNALDESSRATGSRLGGVQGYWVAEADTVTATKPKFRQIELTLHKLMGIYYSTDELIQDAAAMDTVLSQAFAEELNFLRDDAIFQGNGVGKPLGFMKSGALVTVAKETGQAAATIVYENIVNMWSRLLAQSRANAVWLINQEAEPQLQSMYMAVGTGGIPVYMPANSVSGQPYGTIFGRPVLPIEQAAALGTTGDIALVDLNQYILADKGGMNFASSIHVRFLYDEMAFRVTYRCDGMPLLNKPITPYKGANMLSPFVALADRT